MAAAPTERLPVVGPGPLTAPTAPRRRRRGPAGMWLPAAALAALICLVTFYAQGGLKLESMTSIEVALTLLAGVLIAAVAVLGPAGRVHGLGTGALLLAFTVLTALSVVWSVQPDASWQDASRLLAYTAVFAATAALVRLAPSRWPAVLGGITLAAVVVCAYALLTKVFPGTPAAQDLARLQRPFGYWNAIGLTASMGAVSCLWLGARRTGHALLSAMAYPAMGLMLLTLTLAYSRGALAALLVGAGLWLCVVPLRLRAAGVLIVGAAGAAAVTAWDFSRHGPSTATSSARSCWRCCCCSPRWGSRSASRRGAARPRRPPAGAQARRCSR